MAIIKSIAKLIFRIFPEYNYYIFTFCERYIDRANGENNSDPSTNGEEVLLRSVLPTFSGGIVFDVGANIGKWSQFALSVEPTLELHLFEPCLATFKHCSSLEWTEKTIINQYGLGESNEVLEINIVGETMTTNSLYNRKGVDSVVAKRTESIQIKTLDWYCNTYGVKRINFLKIDVEGHELAVLRGASQMLKEGRIDMIQFEYGGCNLDARVYLFDIWDLLQKSGYTISKIFHDGPRLKEKYYQDLETFKYCNYLAQKKI